MLKYDTSVDVFPVNIVNKFDIYPGNLYHNIVVAWSELCQSTFAATLGKHTEKVLEATL